MLTVAGIIVAFAVVAVALEADGTALALFGIAGAISYFS